MVVGTSISHRAAFRVVHESTISALYTQNRSVVIVSHHNAGCFVWGKRTSGPEARTTSDRHWASGNWPHVPS
jgi:DNA-binding transcriptional MocR family regulator